MSTSRTPKRLRRHLKAQFPSIQHRLRTCLSENVRLYGDPEADPRPLPQQRIPLHEARAAWRVKNRDPVPERHS